MAHHLWCCLYCSLVGQNGCRWQDSAWMYPATSSDSKGYKDCQLCSSRRGMSNKRSCFACFCTHFQQFWQLLSLECVSSRYLAQQEELGMSDEPVQWQTNTQASAYAAPIRLEDTEFCIIGATEYRARAAELVSHARTFVHTSNTGFVLVVPHP